MLLSVTPALFMMNDCKGIRIVVMTFWKVPEWLYGFGIGPKFPTKVALVGPPRLLRSKVWCRLTGLSLHCLRHTE